MKFNRSRCLKAVGVTAVALGALGTASMVQANGNVSVGVGIQAVPGVHMGAGTAYPGYLQPVYVQTQPAYVQQSPEYIQAAPEQVQIIYQSAPAYYPYYPYYYSSYPYYPNYYPYWGGALVYGSFWGGHRHSGHHVHHHGGHKGGHVGNVGNRGGQVGRPGGQVRNGGGQAIPQARGGGQRMR